MENIMEKYNGKMVKIKLIKYNDINIIYYK